MKHNAWVLVENGWDSIETGWGLVHTGWGLTQLGFDITLVHNGGELMTHVPNFTQGMGGPKIALQGGDGMGAWRRRGGGSRNGLLCRALCFV